MIALYAVLIVLVLALIWSFGEMQTQRLRVRRLVKEVQSFEAQLRRAEDKYDNLCTDHEKLKAVYNARTYGLIDPYAGLPAAHASELKQFFDPKQIVGTSIVYTTTDGHEYQYDRPDPAAYPVITLLKRPKKRKKENT